MVLQNERIKTHNERLDLKNRMGNKNLIHSFIKSSERFPNRPALDVNNRIYTFKQLARVAGNIALSIDENQLTSESLVAVLGYRSIIAYAGVLGVLISGNGYVPLNPRFPSERTYNMFALAKCKALIVGKECFQELLTLLPKLDKPTTIILPDTHDTGDLSATFPQHRFIVPQNIVTNQVAPDIPDVDPISTAYLLFTSGSTGIPKGVPVSHENVTSYIEYTCERYDLDENDRFSQTFDMTFDLSVHDMFVCWEVGACLCCVPEGSVMAPAKFIRDKNITAWFSVPSVGMFMSKLKMLKPDSFPNLRYSLFCGESLPASLAERWQAAAPNSILENLYGPTEATIAITNYRWKKNDGFKRHINDIVPIGWIFRNQKSCIVDKDFNPVSTGESGELCLSGTQVTKGYLNNTEKTRSQYIKIPACDDEIWYRTGDLVKQDKDGCMHYLGRIDNQIKIRGYRIELQEIDAILRKAAKTDVVVSVAWPIKDGRAEGIVGFICNEDSFSDSEIISYCKKYLPEYMVPAKVCFIKDMPLNSNGKIDRLRLVEMLRR